MNNRKPRIKIMCTVCNKVFTENRSQARKRFNRENQDQCHCKQCQAEYRAGKFTKEAQQRALEYNTVVARKIKETYITPLSQSMN